MAIGDDAVAAGMTTVVGSAAGSAAAIDDYINRAEDYIANGPTYWKPAILVPIARGGHGATTAPAARTALGITAENLGVWKNSGAVSSGQTPTLGWNGSRIEFAIPGYAFATSLANLSDVGNAVQKGGDTMTGDLYLPNSSAASSGWSNAYIDGNGRVCRGASSLRYKKRVSEFDPEDLGDIFPTFHRFQMRSNPSEPEPAENKWRYGPIAEDMAAHSDQDPFVVYREINGEMVPDSFDATGLLVAQNAQLHARLTRLEALVEALTA